MTHIKKIIIYSFLANILFIFLISPFVVYGEEVLGYCNCQFKIPFIEGTPLPPAELMTEAQCLVYVENCVFNADAASQKKADEAAAAPKPCPPDRICLENPINTDNIPVAFGRAIKVVTGIMGSLALLVFVYGGFMWLTAAGNPEHVKKGTQAMIWAVIGIIVVFSSYAIITLVLNAIGAT
ncbi:MAG: hypothetical protein HYV41_03970 [Candidatus Magasanikbacteria bacterium]|nr:hypothetical protein [Candidatus Magasanikbacteria bacterium]